MRPSRLLNASNTQFFINAGSFSSLVHGYHTAALLWLLRNGVTVVLTLPKLWGQQPIDWEPLVYRTCCWVLCEPMWPGGTAVSTVAASFSIPTNNAERSQSLMQLIEEKSLETENWTNGLNKQGSNKSTLNSPFTVHSTDRTPEHSRTVLHPALWQHIYSELPFKCNKTPRNM